MCIAQNVKLEEKSAPIDRKDIVQAATSKKLTKIDWIHTDLTQRQILFY